VRIYHVYLMASRSRVLYTGVTNNLARRVNEHKRGLIPGFTSRYRVTLRDSCPEAGVDARALLDRGVTMGPFASGEPSRNAVGVGENGEHSINARGETVDRSVAYGGHERGRLVIVSATSGSSAPGR
jgi:hypothetical protein